MLLEAVQAREVGGGQKVAIDPQMGETPRARPIGQLGVNALAVHHQRRQQADVLTAEILHQLRCNLLGRLRRHRRAVMDAMLGAKLDEQEPQKVPDLGGGTHRRFAPAAAQALLDRHRRRYAVHRIDLGPACRLHDGARISVERLEVAALAFVEQDVERQGGFARARDPGDHGELAARDVDAERLQVVFAGVDDLDAVGVPMAGCWRSSQ